MIVIRKPNSIYQSSGDIENGTFTGRWHFSFDEYYDPQFVQFGNLRVFNDDTLSPGATWPLHPHKEIEVVTYCAGGEFKHADEHGEGTILKKGWVQHTTVGSGMWHAEINNLPDKPMRFIQMWFIPEKPMLPPGLEQKKVEKKERTNTFLPLVGNKLNDALPLRSDAAVYSCFLEKNKNVIHAIDVKRGYYLYVLEGGAVSINGNDVSELGAVMITNETQIEVSATQQCELLLIDVGVYV